MKKYLLLGTLALSACANMTPVQQQAAITLAVQQGATLVSLLGGHQAQQWIAAGGLVCKIGNTYVAGLGINVVGTPAQTMEAACNGLGGSGTALPAGVDPATVLVAMIQSFAAKKS